MAKMISRGITAWQGEERCSARTGTEVEIPRNPGPPAAPRTAAATLLHIFDERRGMNVAEPQMHNYAAQCPKYTFASML